MRRRKPAPHGFAVNGNLNKRVDFDVPYLQPAPRQPWEPCGQACSLQAVHWLPRGLADYNPRSASPSDVWANDIVYHNPPAQGRGEKGNHSLFPVKMHRSKLTRQAAIPFQGGSLLAARHGAFSEVRYYGLLVARSGGNVPAWLVLSFQAARRTFLFPRSPHSPGKRPESFRL